MNDLELVASFLDEAGPSPKTTAAGRRRLDLALDGPARRRLRPTWTLAGVGLVAAATTVATLLVVPGTERPASARAILLRAATAQDNVAKTGRYWHTKRTVSGVVRVGEPGARYFIRGRMEGETWADTEPEPKSFLLVGSAGRIRISPDTDQDTAAWKKAGSPSEWKGNGFKKGPCLDLGLIGTCGPYKLGDTGTGAGGYLIGSVDPKTDAKNPIVYYARTSDGTRGLSFAEAGRLPADPAGLRAALLAKAAKTGGEGDRLWVWAKALITQVPVASKVRAAAFRVLADLPGVRAEGATTDPIGRKGVAVARAHVETDPEKSRPPRTGPLEDRLVIDESTGWVLAAETRVLAPQDDAEGLTKGALWGFELIEKTGWTDKAKTLPFKRP